ncbi:phosphoethanolamine transferase [uncultured Azohydromonas sp.]|uniref:phosphoethanolamine transferase n=1 Tax=uncultured Azohydromonas sp. TaxID=487342 RepID=UPI00260F24F0|nr:phosphoethanolamine--lipid A transferase [uncultured Azohydromonas sp.]
MPERRFEIPATVEQVALVASLFWTLAANRLFFAAALHGRSLAEPATWGFVLALGVMLLALHAALLLTLLVHRRLLKPLLAVLIVATAFATHFMERFGVYLDPSMLRNVLRTDVAEARELLSWTLALHLLLYAALPLALLSRVRIVRRPPLRALLVRGLALAGAVTLLVGALLSVFQPFSSLMRNHKEMRYLITPANWMWSLASVSVHDARGAAQPRQAIGLDAAPGLSWAAQARPRLLVLVVGETARRANWGLGGYARQTTPQLAQLPVINFADVTACGTNTEVSVPCMFAPVGRRDYDEQRIRGSESLLHVLARAGVAVHWRDNQSGCKGVCDHLSADDTASMKPSGLCDKGHCLDEALLRGLDQRLEDARGTQLLVLHMLGSHGPAYHRRYPPTFKRFKPACESDDLQQCSAAEIVNAYDNALLYTDHVLASLIRLLQAHAGRVDAAMLYVSDHGESLGERGLFLHGMPYPVAPAEQKQVPMVMWSSPDFARAIGLDTACLQRRAMEPVSHDHLFHSLLGLLDVRTSLHEPAWDLSAGCRTSGYAK